MAAVVPVMVFSAVMMFRVLEHERSALEARLEEKAAQLAEAIDTELRQTITALEVVSLSNAVISGDLESFHLLATRLAEAQPHWANVMLVGPRGEHLVNARQPFGAPLPPLSRPDLPAAAAASGQPLVSDVAHGAVTGRHLTAVYVPVLRAGEVKYVLVAGIEPDNWRKLLESRLPSGMGALVFDRNAALVASTLEGERLAGNTPSRSLMDAVASDSRGASRGPLFGGMDGYAAYRKLSLSGWTVAAVMPVEALESPVRTSFGGLATGLLLLLSVGLALALAFARRIAQAMSQLVASVREVSHGGAPLPVEGEIAEVRDARDALTDAAALLAARLQREEAARGQLEAAGRAKDEFLAMLGHELRNPLGPMHTAMEILERTDAASAEAVFAKSVIKRQSAHLARLVDDLLDVTRIERGKIELRKELVDLVELVERTVQDHRELFGKAGLALRLELAQGRIDVHGDPVRLAQILGNLLQNAAKFTPRGGQVTVSLAQRDGRAELEVGDTGAGIAPEDLARLFEPFTQGPQDMARSGGGLGLGLALVKGLAELHGGSVRAASAGKGRGASFVVSLPAQD